MQATHILTISVRECYQVSIVEVCKPRSKFDMETHRVKLPSGGILRVRPDQLSNIPGKYVGQVLVDGEEMSYFTGVQF